LGLELSFGVLASRGVIIMSKLSRIGLLSLAALLLSSASAMAQAKKHAPADLAVGKLAPEISGVDVDGRKFKLSDYRGKVVVLDFWGDW
jgi:cytochrome oxidase Cu insertion factor (SCO1/SenC/PrrC family)